MFDVTALGAHTKVDSKTLLVKSTMATRTIAKLKAAGRVLTGVKSKAAVPVMDTDAVLQDGKACGFTPLGTTKLTKREVEVSTIKVNERLCPSDVEETFEQENLTAGSDYTAIIFESQYKERKAKRISIALEKLIWKGDKASADANLKRIDGFVKQFNAEPGMIDANDGSITTVNKANVIDVLDTLYESFPEDIIENEDNFVVCSPSVFRSYILAMRDKNYYKDFKLDGSNFEVPIIGTNLTLMSTPGLSGIQRLYGFSWSNLLYATDLLDEDEKIELKYAPEAEEVRFKAKWKSGVSYAFPDEIIKFTW